MRRLRTLHSRDRTGPDAAESLNVVPSDAVGTDPSRRLGVAAYVRAAHAVRTAQTEAGGPDSGHGGTVWGSDPLVLKGCVSLVPPLAPVPLASILSLPMTYKTFLDAVQEHLELDDPDEASTLMTVVLETFSEILYRTERDTLSAPLPRELAHHLRAAEPEHTREQMERLTASAFLDRVQARADLSRADAQAATAAVLTVLQEAVGGSVLSDIGDSLPPSYTEIFPFMPDSDTSSTA